MGGGGRQGSSRQAGKADFRGRVEAEEEEMWGLEGTGGERGEKESEEGRREDEMKSDKG